MAAKQLTLGDKIFGPIFGASWQTTVSGYLTMIFLTIYAEPQTIAFIPEPFKGFLWNISKFLFAAGFITFAHQAKSRKVQGGSLQQDKDGSIAEPQRSTPEPPTAALATPTKP